MNKQEKIFLKASENDQRDGTSRREELMQQ